MITTNHIITVLAIVGLSIAVNQSAVSAVEQTTTMQYGQLGHQEDESYFYHDGVLYINIVPQKGNGLFIAENDIDSDYSIEQAIERFGINKDTTSFEVQPSIYSDVQVTYELDSNLQFQIIRIGA